ncbi:TPR-like protein [Clavulina sp. PMI_390]|nr:TPR-like protein [Clavulina sp. PMI_390]
MAPKYMSLYCRLRCRCSYSPRHCCRGETPKPPLSWLLFSGHRDFQTLQKFAEGDGAPTPLAKWNPHPLLRWHANAKRLLDSHWLSDVEQPLPKGFGTHSGSSSSEMNKLLQLPPPSLVHYPERGAPFCDAEELTTWYISNMVAIDENSFGRLQELYLFRSKKSPFHHEFLVVGFGDDGEDITSWIRIERGARMRNGSSGPIVGVHSSGPVLGDVKARETVSFSSSKATLSVNADELAKAILSAPTTLPIHIGGILNQIQSTSNSNEMYQLFSTNCRWYSRRSFINVLQWCDAAHIPATLLWKGTTTSLGFIRGKLEKERFGGSKLVDLRAKYLDHRNLLDLTAVQQDSIPLSRAILDPFFESLMTATLDPDERIVLIADLLTKRSFVVADEDLSQSLDDAEQAVKLIRGVKEDIFQRNNALAWSLTALASALRLDGRLKESIPLLRESLELNDALIPFDTRHYELGLAYQQMGQMGEAITTLREAADLLARTDHDQSWQFTRQHQIEVLVLLAQILESLGRHVESIPVREEIVFMRRDLPAKNDFGDDLLVLALIDLATCAMLSENLAISLKASTEAVRLCRADPSGVRLLSISLALNARVLYGLDDVKSAIRDITTAIELHGPGANDFSTTVVRGIWLNMRSTYFINSGDMHHGLEDIEAAIPLYESTHIAVKNNADIVSQLWTLHFTRADVLKSLGRVDDAVDAFRRAAEVLRPAVDAKAGVPEERFMELVSTLEASVATLRELDRLDEARVCEEESITRLRLRLHSPVSSNLVGETLCSALMRHSKLLAGLGDEEEALCLATEAADICDQIGDVERRIEALLHRLLLEVENGYPERALATAEECLELCGSRLPDRLDIRSYALTSYARALDEVGRHSDAAEKQKESLALFHELAGFPSLDARLFVAQRLVKLAEYYQNADLFGQALVPIKDAVEHYQKLYEDGDDDGLAYCAAIARRASILFSLNERKEARHMLDEEVGILKTVLKDMPIGDILECS